MAFSKAAYRKRREQGLRGQGDKPVTAVVAQAMAPAPNRRKSVDRRFTKKGYTHVVKVEEGGQAHRVPTKVGSKIHQKAVKNSKKLQQERTTARGA